MMTDYREPTARERELFQKLLSVDFPGRDELAKQLAVAQVHSLDTDGSLKIQTTVDLSAPVSRRVPVEAEAPDVDGVPIYILLHVVDGRAYELELYKADGSRISRPPDTQGLVVSALSSHGGNRRRGA